jgi:hypothetical protein
MQSHRRFVSGRRPEKQRSRNIALPNADSVDGTSRVFVDLHERDGKPPTLDYRSLAGRKLEIAADIDNLRLGRIGPNNRAGAEGKDTEKTSHA